MGQLKKRSLYLFHSRKQQIALFLVCVLGTICALLVPHLSLDNTSGSNTGYDPCSYFSCDNTRVVIRADLSQSKLVQDDPGRVYLNVSVATPSMQATDIQKPPLDLVLVLDTSGSMAAENKLQLAKQAIERMTGSLTEADRIGLVTFSTTARTVSPLAFATQPKRQHLISQVRQIYAAGSTNISDALFKAEALIERSSSNRMRKIILLSDGIANNGITQATELNRIAKRFNPRNVILSTVGMGLDFNERVLASLADNGMGAYSYLEHLGALDQILSAELRDLRQVYAATSRLLIHAGPAVRLIDAAGYPVERNGRNIEIPTGQLLYDSTKRLVLSFNVPTDAIGNREIGQLTLRIERNNETSEIQSDLAPLVVAVVERSQINDALATINKSVFRDIWSKNNLGVMEHAVSQAVRSGNKDLAFKELDKYEANLAQAEGQSGIALQDERLRSNLVGLRRKVDGAFSGPPAALAMEQSRVAKELHQSGRSNQIQMHRK